jgi:hypothetical protein
MGCGGDPDVFALGDDISILDRYTSHASSHRLLIRMTPSMP